MQRFYFLLKCPKCGHGMKYHTDTKILSDKRKRCVYCGRNFKVKDHVLKQIKN
jgi:transposase-like protein